MKIAMMADLVAGLSNPFDRLGKGVGGVAGDEPGRANTPLAQHREQPMGANITELAARNRARRARVKSADTDRHCVKVDGKTDLYLLCHRESSGPAGIR